MQIDEKYMKRCLQLARAGVAAVRTNPLVGAVIEHGGRIIGEGYHRRYGEAHAEVNAIASVADERLLGDSTLYVNLEPCAHYGKTPPCAELIIRKGIPRVVIGSLDPYPQVAGRGVAMLRQAGIAVVSGVMADEAYRLNRVFMTAQTARRPYVILKWAQTADGFIDHRRAGDAEPPLQLSSAATLRVLHRSRSQVAAILVGTETARLDNPSLTVRHWAGASPVRVVIDRTGRLPLSLRLFDGTVPTIVATERIPATHPHGVEYLPIDFAGDVVRQLLQALYERGLHSLLVEGGARLHRSFLSSGLYDEIRVETAPLRLGDGVAAPALPLSGLLRPEITRYGDHSLAVYYT